MLMARKPDISIFVSDTGHVREDIGRIANRIDSYLSRHGVLVSRHDAKSYATASFNNYGEATYFVKGKGGQGNTVVVGAAPDPPIYIGTMHYRFEISVEGSDKKRLVEELDAQLAEFRIPAKV